MTVAIPEAAAVAPAAGGAGGARAASSRGASRSRAVQRRPTRAEMGLAGPRGRAGGEGPRGPSGEEGPPVQYPRPPLAGEKRETKSKTRERPERPKRREAARRVTGAATRPGGQLHNYQAIIAGEFVAAELLVALRPIATQKPEPSATSGQLSPYYVGDLIKLVAIGLVYLVLMGLAAGPRGLARFTAWFGFLILLGVGLSEAANIGKIFQMLAGAGTSPIKLTGAQAPAVKHARPEPQGVPPPLVPGGATPPPAGP